MDKLDVLKGIYQETIKTMQTNKEDAKSTSEEVYYDGQISALKYAIGEIENVKSKR